MKKFFALVSLVWLVVSCSSDVRETPKGHKFKVAKEGDGQVVKPGDFIVINMMFKDAKDSIWGDTRGQQDPMVLAIQPESAMEREEGVNEVFRMMSKGDSVVGDVPARTVFGNEERARANGMDPEEKFTFYIGLKEVLDSTQFADMQAGIMESRRLAFVMTKKEQMDIDSALIQANLNEKGIEAQRTSSGLRYHITQEGSGKKAKPGDHVWIHYAGYMLDGTLFDTSIASVAQENNRYTDGRPYQPLDLTVGRGEVIQGWEEAIMLMSPGTKMTVWIPSPLAYGERQRSAIIKENSVLVFDMELIQID